MTQRLPAPLPHLIGLASLVASYLVFALFLQVKWAVLVMACLAVHEFAHWLAFRWIGSRAVIYFAFLLGAATVPRDLEAVKDMSDWEEFVLSFAGPFTNLVLMVGGVVWQAGHPGTSDGQIFAAINLSLFVFNLIPFGPVDGNKALRAVFESLNERDDFLVVRVMLFPTGFAVGALLAHGYLPIVLVLAAAAVWRASSKEDPEAWRLKSAMSRTRALSCGVTVALLLVGGGLLSFVYVFDIHSILK